MSQSIKDPSELQSIYALRFSSMLDYRTQVWRILASSYFHGISVGLAFKEQVFDSLPVQENDIPVHMLVTDEEVLRFPHAPKPGSNSGGRK